MVGVTLKYGILFLFCSLLGCGRMMAMTLMLGTLILFPFGGVIEGELLLPLDFLMVVRSGKWGEKRQGSSDLVIVFFCNLLTLKRS